MNVQASGINGAATVSWQPPQSNGGAPITGYVITWPGGSSQAGTADMLATLTLPACKNLTFTVAATNSVGTGPGTTSNSVLTASLPGAPTNVTAVPGPSAAEVSWSAPADSGGCPILNYTVQSGGVTVATSNGASPTATVTGLTDSTAYSFVVYATTEAGDGPLSLPSAEVTPCVTGEFSCAANTCTDLSIDAVNCGTCDHVCTAPTGGSAACVDSVCAGTCPTGKVCGATVDGGGFCADPSNDPDNCGTCGRVCPTPANGMATCSSGACGVSCSSGYADCGGVCVDLSTDAAHCGTCANACASGETCQSSVCGCATSTDTYCAKASACVDLQTDLSDCGTCGNACQLPDHTTGSTCSSGNCGYVACESGYADCNGNAADGCETSTAAFQNDPNNCGGCNINCASPNACSGGQCMPSSETFSATGACQTFTVPVTGTYAITAAGSQGGTAGSLGDNVAGGLGAIISGTFSLTAGQVLQVVVGSGAGGGAQNGMYPPDAATNGGGGGGGSFVFISNDCQTLPAEPLVAAGGGGGGANGGPGLAGTAGGNGVYPGGTNGGGGTGDTAYDMAGSAGGTGWNSPGTAGDPTASYPPGGGGHWAGGIGANQGIGYLLAANGGFGGGGGAGFIDFQVPDPTWAGGGGGGGGYSGGGGSDTYDAQYSYGGPPPSPGGGGGGSYNAGSDQSNTAGANSGDGYVSIALAVQCSGSPVNTATDPNNCGGCGNVCATGQSCLNGTCGCVAGQIYCGSACLDPSNDPSNCGACGNVCGAGLICVNGTCGCPSGTSQCSFGSSGAEQFNCVATSTDPYNCGSCGNVCTPTSEAATMACIDGTCEVATCDPGYADCDADPANGCETQISTDASNCGACGTVCVNSQMQVSGTCCWTPGEPNGCYPDGTDCSTLIQCPDNASTQAAGTANTWAACPSGGQFACTGAAANDCVCFSQTCCDSYGGVYCSNISGGGCFPAGTDCSTLSSCGSIVASCGAGAQYSCGLQSCVCTSQSCCTQEAAGTTYCPGIGCPDLSTDPQNCGTCGNTCAAGDICVNGACTAPCPTGSAACTGTVSMINYLGGQYTPSVPYQADCTSDFGCGKGPIGFSFPYTCPSPEPALPVCLSGDLLYNPSNGDCICEPAAYEGTTVPSLGNFCNGVCVDLLNDANNCGACGRVCPTEYGLFSARCVNGCCEIGTKL